MELFSLGLGRSSSFKWVIHFVLGIRDPKIKDKKKKKPQVNMGLETNTSQA